MIGDTPLYTGSGGGVKAHSIRRRKVTPPVRQRTLPETCSMSPVRPRPSFTRQRSLSPGRMLGEQDICPQGPPRVASMTSMSVTTGRRLPRRPGSLSDMARTNRRLVLALDQFTSTALPFYLELIARYAAKIQRLRADHKISEEGFVLEQASKAVRQLGSLMFEMEVLRSFLETGSELRYFDSRVNPAKIVAHRAVNRLKALCPDQASKLELTSARCNFRKLDKKVRRYSETELISDREKVIPIPRKKESASLTDISCGNSSMMGGKTQTKEDLLLNKAAGERAKKLRFDDVIHDLQSDALRICNEKIKQDPSSANTETWRILEEEISDVKLLIETYHEERTVRVRRSEPEPDPPTPSHQLGPAQVYPMAGAVLGSCIGAPVGFLAGIKIGGLASLSGIIAGYSTGTIVKKFAQQQEKIDSVFSEIGPQDKGRLRNFDLQAKRAVSLPDMLNDDDVMDNEKLTIGNARKIWMRQAQVKSSENLLI